MTSRHLRALGDPQPDPMEGYWRGFGQTILGIHLFNGTARAERQVRHLLEEAREGGLDEEAEGYALALSVLQDTREKLK